MSEERGKRDDRSEDLSTPDSSTSDSSTSESAAPGSDAAAGSPSGGESARPTGKRTARRSRTAAGSSTGVSVTKAATSKTSATSRTSGTSRTSAATREPKRPNIFKRLIKFLREVIAELRKVIWPNRKQMITYTSVVLVFVAFMVAYISGADLLFGRGVQWLFG